MRQLQVFKISIHCSFCSISYLKISFRREFWRRIRFSSDLSKCYFSLFSISSLAPLPWIFQKNSSTVEPPPPPAKYAAGQIHLVVGSRTIILHKVYLAQGVPHNFQSHFGSDPVMLKIIAVRVLIMVQPISAINFEFLEYAISDGQSHYKSLSNTFCIKISYY